MKKAHKAAAIFLIALMIVSVFSGCGGDADSSSQIGSEAESSREAVSAAAETESSAVDAGEEDAEPVTVHYYTWEAQEEDNPIWEEILAELNINVEIHTLVDDGSVNKETQLDIIQSSGADLDLRIINEANASTRIKQGFAEPLNELVEANDVDMEGIFGQFLKSVTYDDKYYGIPVRANMQMFFYNKDIFDAANEPYPEDGWSWDECMDTARRLTKGEGADKVFGFAINGATQSFADQAIVGGATWYTEDNKCNISDPLFRTALTSMVEMDADGIKPTYVSMRSRNSYISVEFLTGNVAIAAGQSYMIRDMKDKENFPFDFEVGVVYPPVMNEGDSPKSLGYTAPFVAISPNSKNKEAAFKAMIYYMEHGADYITSFSIPPVKDPTEQTMRALLENTPLTEEDVRRFFDSENTLNRAGIPGGPAVTEYTQAVNEEIDLCLTGAQDVDTTLKNIEQRATEAIEAEAAEEAQ